MPSSKLPALTSLALVLVTAGLPASAASAHSQVRSSHTVTFTEHSTFDEPASSSMPCDQPSATCLIHTSGPTNWHGGISGTSKYDLYIYLDPASPTDLTFYGPNKFEVATHIQGCGTGKFVADNYNGHEHLAQPDVPSQSFSGENDWTIEPGSGTGELKGISGHGHDVYTDESVSPGALNGGNSYVGYSDGQITCIPHDEAASRGVV